MIILLPEQWKPIAGYEGRYDISSYGRVWSHLSNKCLKQGLQSRDAYLMVCLYGGPCENWAKGRKSWAVHQLVAAAFLGPTPEGMVVDHEDRNSHNNNVTNLRHATNSENVRNSDRYDLSKKRRKAA